MTTTTTTTIHPSPTISPPTYNTSSHQHGIYRKYMRRPSDDDDDAGEGKAG